MYNVCIFISEKYFYIEYNFKIYFFCNFESIDFNIDFGF